MIITSQQNYIPYTAFIPVLEPDDDLELLFMLFESDDLAPAEACSTPVLIPCNHSGMNGVVESATLIWRNCSSTQLIDAEVGDIEIVDGKTVSIKIIVEDIYLSTSNDFELQVIMSGNLYKLARGRVFI